MVRGRTVATSDSFGAQRTQCLALGYLSSWPVSA